MEERGRQYYAPEDRCAPEDRDEYEERHEHGVRALPALFKDLINEATTLFQQEVALAKAEIGEKVTQVTAGIGSIKAGAAILYVGFLYLLLAGIVALNNVWPAWASCLVVGGAAVIVGAIMLAVGRSRLKRQNLAPKRTVETLEEDRDMIAEKL
jgi:hypothetical protein